MAEASAYLQGLVVQCRTKRKRIPICCCDAMLKVCMTETSMGNNCGIYNGVWQKQSVDNCKDCTKSTGGTGLIVHVSSPYVAVQGKTLASGPPAHIMLLTCTRQRL